VEIPTTHKRWIAPPAMRQVNDLMPSGREVYRELVGKQFGRLTVLGILIEDQKKGEAVWVVRCVCGYYEGRKAKSLRSCPHEQMCFVCCRVEALRARGRGRNTKASRKASAARLDTLASGGNR
jgi:hypothetical protein